MCVCRLLDSILARTSRSSAASACPSGAGERGRGSGGGETADATDSCVDPDPRDPCGEACAVPLRSATSGPHTGPVIHRSGLQSTVLTPSGLSRTFRSLTWRPGPRTVENIRKNIEKSGGGAPVSVRLSERCDGRSLRSAWRSALPEGTVTTPARRPAEHCEW